MDGQSKVNDEINKQLLNTNSARGVLTFCEWSAGEFDVTNAVTALHRMARAPDRRYYARDPRWPGVIGKAQEMIIHTCSNVDAWPRLSKEYLLNAAWSFSVLNHRDEYLCELISEEVLAAPDLSPQDLAGLIRSLGKLQIQSEATLARILTAARARMEQFRPPQLAGLAWGLATLERRDEDIMDRIAKEAIGKVRLFQPRHLSELAWAFATLGVRRPALNGAMTDATIGRMEEFHPKELANIVLSFSKLAAGSESVMEVAAERLGLHLQDLDPDSIEKVASAFAAAAFTDEALMSGLAAEVLNRLEDFRPRHLAAISGAFAALDVKEDLLAEAMQGLVAMRVEAFSAADIARIVPAFVKWGAKKELEGVLFASILARLEQFSPRDLVATAEAYAAHGNARLLAELLRGAVPRFLALSAYADAELWVRAAALAAVHAEEDARAAFEAGFAAAVLRPLRRRLREVGDGGGAGGGPGAAAACGRGEEAMAALGQHAEAEQLQHLGPHFTQHALAGQLFPCLSAPIIKAPDLLDVAKGDIIVGASWELQWRRRWWVEPVARLFCDGAPRSGCKLLPSLAGARPSAGRRALLHAAAPVARACPEERLHEVLGRVRLLASRPLTIDALAALCQFRRRFTRVLVEVDYVS